MKKTKSRLILLKSQHLHLHEVGNFEGDSFFISALSCF